MNENMINTDYNISAMDILLVKNCISEKYYPLIRNKTVIISGLRKAGCKTKNDASALSDETLGQIGLENVTEIKLFRRFLALYDPNPQKFKEINLRCTDPAERSDFFELYHLPGVRYVRASLYRLAGLKSLKDFADADENDILEKTARAITGNGLSYIVPLPKEVRTHIAVAKAFLWNND